MKSKDAVQELLKLCQACWSEKELPETWRTAKVVMLYKKGDNSLPQNYRPISLLPVGYKILAWMIQKRLQNGGAESHIRKSQFGFRPKRGTIDAIGLVRRLFDAAYSVKDPGLMAVMLDWAKAFDRLKTDVMVESLLRFGIPTPMVNMISSIYKIREFQVSDLSGTSASRIQEVGIAQGCPLSLYLFIIVQTVMMHDVDTRLGELGHVEEPAFMVTNDVLYADDTMLFSTSPVRLQNHLDLVVDEGKRYGLELNWEKTMVLRIHCTANLHGPDGVVLKVVPQMVYLGGLICSLQCLNL